MNSMRNLFIVGVALFLGFSVPEYFREYTSKALHGPTHTRAGWVSLLFHLYELMKILLFSWLDLNQEGEALTDSSECRPWGSHGLSAPLSLC